MRTGVVYIRVRLTLNQDVSSERADRMVQEMDYEFKDEKGLIADTEITDWDVNPNNSPLVEHTPARAEMIA